MTLLQNDTKSNAATFLVQLEPWEERSITSNEVIKKLQNLINKRSDSTGQAVNPAPIRGLGRAGGLDFIFSPEKATILWLFSKSLKTSEML